MTKGCIVPQCRTGYKSMKKKYSVFQVPSNMERLKEWLAAIPGIAQLKPTQCVCEKHFEERFILRKWIKRDFNGRIIAEVSYKRPRLDLSAVPSIFDSDNEPQDSCSNQRIVNDHIVTADTSNKENELSAFNCIDEHIPQDCLSQRIVNDHIVTADTLNMDNESTAFDSIGEHIEASYCTQDMRNDDSSTMKQIDADSLTQATNVDPLLDPELRKLPEKLEVSDQKFDIISKITMSVCSSGAQTNSAMGEKSLVTIPKLWGFAELKNNEGLTILFSYSVMKLENGIKVPITQKNVVITSDRTVSYYVYGRAIAAEKHKLNGRLDDVRLLPKILETFQNMNVCNGLGDVNIHLLSVHDVVRDYVDRWRHKDCTMISTRKRCDCCTKMTHLVHKKEARLKKNGTLTRVHRASNPIDERKLVALRKKSLRERKGKNRALRRVRLLHSTEL